MSGLHPARSGLAPYFCLGLVAALLFDPCLCSWVLEFNEEFDDFRPSKWRAETNPNPNTNPNPPTPNSWNTTYIQGSRLYIAPPYASFPNSSSTRNPNPNLKSNVSTTVTSTIPFNTSLGAVFEFRVLHPQNEGVRSWISLGTHTHTYDEVEVVSTTNRSARFTGGLNPSLRNVSTDQLTRTTPERLACSPNPKEGFHTFGVQLTTHTDTHTHAHIQTYIRWYVNEVTFFEVDTTELLSAVAFVTFGVSSTTIDTHPAEFVVDSFRYWQWNPDANLSRSTTQNHSNYTDTDTLEPYNSSAIIAGGVERCTANMSALSASIVNDTCEALAVMCEHTNTHTYAYNCTDILESCTLASENSIYTLADYWLGLYYYENRGWNETLNTELCYFDGMGFKIFVASYHQSLPPGINITGDIFAAELGLQDFEVRQCPAYPNLTQASYTPTYAPTSTSAPTHVSTYAATYAPTHVAPTDVPTYSPTEFPSCPPTPEGPFWYAIQAYLTMAGVDRKTLNTPSSISALSSVTENLAGVDDLMMDVTVLSSQPTAFCVREGEPYEKGNKMGTVRYNMYVDESTSLQQVLDTISEIMVSDSTYIRLLKGASGSFSTLYCVNITSVTWKTTDTLPSDVLIDGPAAGDPKKIIYIITGTLVTFSVCVGWIGYLRHLYCTGPHTHMHRRVHSYICPCMRWAAYTNVELDIEAEHLCEDTDIHIHPNVIEMTQNK